MAEPATVTMKCVELHAYAGRLIYCGQEYEVPANEVESLIKRGVAVRKSAPQPSRRAPSTYRRRDMVAEQQPATTAPTADVKKPTAPQQVQPQPDTDAKD